MVCSQKIMKFIGSNRSVTEWPHERLFQELWLLNKGQCLSETLPSLGTGAFFVLSINVTLSAVTLTVIATLKKKVRDRIGHLVVPVLAYWP